MTDTNSRPAPVVFAIANQKGGVGKTTTAVSLGAELGARGIRTLIIDLDPQANATAALGLSDADRACIYDVVVDEAPLAGIVVETIQQNLYLAPSGPDLAGAEVELVPAMAREQRLRRAIASLGGAYEAVIIDCPPSLSLLTLNGLNAADEVLVPVQCEYLALEGLSQLMVTLDAVKRALNPNLNLGGLLLTMYDNRTGLSRQVAEEVRRHFENTFKTIIPRSIRLSEAPSHGLPINQYAAGSPAAKAYEAFAGEVVRTFLPSHATSEVS
jgi:chromosome partitioning protein